MINLFAAEIRKMLLKKSTLEAQLFQETKKKTFSGNQKNKPFLIINQHRKDPCIYSDRKPNIPEDNQSNNNKKPATKKVQKKEKR